MTNVLGEKFVLFIQRELKILHKPAGRYNYELIEYKIVV
jgi:hypothetical protein